MPDTVWLKTTSPAFRLMIATSWLAPEAFENQQAEAIRQAVAAGVDWAEYLFLVDSRHRTPALSWAALNRVQGIAVPEPQKHELLKLSDACRMNAVRHCLLLAEVLKAFNRAQIPLMPLKGPILSFELYADLALRQSKDLDLAVQTEHVAKAQTCLNQLGWHLDSTWFSMTPRQWQAALRQEPHLGFVHARTGIELELHWRNWWDTPDLTHACWARSLSSVWQGCSFQSMNPSDMVIYLCSHGGQHFWSRAKWLGDLARLHAMGKVDWETALEQARQTGQERVLLAALQLLDRLHGLPLPALPGNPWASLPSLLAEMPLQALNAPEEAATHTALNSPRSRLRLSRYQRLLRPQKSLRDSFSQLLYHREDFRTIPLPDGLFWAYIPLRPILWAWRFVRRSGGRTSEISQIRA
jgi:hypothetical protein